MPLYEYRCTACGHRFEKIQSFSAPDEKECPVCKGEVERLISAPAVHFSGSGFYSTDYKAKPPAAPRSTGAESKDGAASSSEGSKDSSAATKSDGGAKPESASPNSSSTPSAAATASSGSTKE